MDLNKMRFKKNNNFSHISTGASLQFINIVGFVVNLKLNHVKSFNVGFVYCRYKGRTLSALFRKTNESTHNQKFKYIKGKYCIVEIKL